MKKSEFASVLCDCSSAPYLHEHTMNILANLRLAEEESKKKWRNEIRRATMVEREMWHSDQLLEIKQGWSEFELVPTASA